MNKIRGGLLRDTCNQSALWVSDWNTFIHCTIRGSFFKKIKLNLILHSLTFGISPKNIFYICIYYREVCLEKHIIVEIVYKTVLGKAEYKMSLLRHQFLKYKCKRDDAFIRLIKKIKLSGNFHGSNPVLQAMQKDYYKSESKKFMTEVCQVHIFRNLYI